MSPRLFSYYSCWLSNLPAMRKYMREGGGGAQPLACAIVKVEAWSKTRFMVSSAEGFRRFRMFDLCDTQAQTQMTRLLLDSWTSVFIFQVVAMERWAESAAQRRRRRTRAGGTRPCVAPAPISAAALFLRRQKPRYVHLRCAINVMELSRC